MTDELIIKLGEETLKVTAMVASPMLIGALVVGLVVSILQAITQINEATMTFIPKMAIVGIIFIIAGPWMMDQLSQFTIHLFEGLAEFVRQ